MQGGFLCRSLFGCKGLFWHTWCPLFWYFKAQLLPPVLMYMRHKVDLFCGSLFGYTGLFWTYLLCLFWVAQDLTLPSALRFVRAQVVLFCSSLSSYISLYFGVFARSLFQWDLFSNFFWSLFQLLLSSVLRYVRDLSLFMEKARARVKETGYATHIWRSRVLCI